MDKKQYINGILSELIPYWPQANDILSGLNDQDISDDYIKKLTTIFQDAVKTLKNTEAKNKMKKSVNMLKKLQEKENFEREKESQEVEDLLNNI